jgi:outer membrane protein assembly factor BamB
MTRRRWVFLALVLALVLSVAAVVGGWWYREHTKDKEVVGSSTVEFVPREKPQAKPRPPKTVETIPWPTYGYDNQRTHLSPFNHRPPYRRLWMLRARWYVEYPPAIGYGKVFVSQLKGVFFAVDAKTGEWHWRRKFPYCSAASPAVARHLVVAAFIPTPCTRGPRGVPGAVLAMREKDGRTLWRAPIASESSPLVVGSRVFVGSWDHRLYALGLGTGKLLWSTRVDGEINSSAAYSGGMVFVGDNSGTLTALDAQTGAVRWKARSFSRFGSGREYFYATPTVAYGRVYASNTDGTVYAFGAGTGNLLWATHVGSYVYTAPAVWNRRIFVGAYDGTFAALDAATGATRWVREMPAAIHGAPTVMAGLVYFSTCGFCGQHGSRSAKRGPNGTYALEARTGKLVWTFPEGQYSPIVADGERVYLTGATRVYGLVERKRSSR